MSVNEITCDVIDEKELDTDYLAGRLSPEDAEAFEAHYFGCDRCWGLVQAGLEVQGAYQPCAPSLGSTSTLAKFGNQSYRRWYGLAAAAGIAAVALGLWQVSDPSEPRRPENFRGENSEFRVTTAAPNGAPTASWPHVTDADLYQVRLYAADGVLMLERETTDTALSLSTDSIPRVAAGVELFWQVQAFDRLRNSIAQSALAPAPLADF